MAGTTRMAVGVGALVLGSFLFLSSSAVLIPALLVAVGIVLLVMAVESRNESSSSIWQRHAAYRDEQLQMHHLGFQSGEPAGLRRPHLPPPPMPTGAPVPVLSPYAPPPAYPPHPPSVGRSASPPTERHCPACGSPAARNAKYCLHCGRPLPAPS